MVRDYVVGSYYRRRRGGRQVTGRRAAAQLQPCDGLRSEPDSLGHDERGALQLQSCSGVEGGCGAAPSFRKTVL